ncbi:MAG: radical SAM protein, partial [Candidatus Omnitrophica bacterium]|nr:radical SAM protein [Candidatus Omnitrophota bacterium]
MIQTVSGCNASCKFCPYPYIREHIPFCKMDNNTFRKIIDECSHHKNIKVIMPYLMNEPLLDRNLPEKIGYIKAKVPWAKVHILTNGSLLDKEFALSLIKSGIDWIGFSFHGIYPHTIEEVMGVDYQVTLNNILNFIETAKMSRK